jgi:hypothetical protein
MAINPNTTFTTGAVFTADQANRFPRGIVAYTLTAATNITYTSTETLSITSSSFTAVANRYYQAFYVEGTTYGTATAEASARIKLDTTSGTVLGVTRATISSTASTNLYSTGLFTTTAGSHVVVGTLQIGAGGGTGTAYRLDIGASIWVVDMGPA